MSVLANRLITSLSRRQPELEVSDRDVKCVTLAGLCHDLGHGPFSHAFEDWLHRLGKKFSHEEMSLKILDYMVDANSIDIEREDLRFVQSLIAGKPTFYGERMERMDGRLWMYEIVANHRNSIDVDKWDYLARDCYFVGMKSSYDHSRLLAYSRVIEDEICYHAKEAYNIYELFHTRYSLFKQVYSHRVGKSIEFMIGDAFRLADPILGISDAVNDVELYSSMMTDNLLRTIECSRDPAMKPAKDIVTRIRKRDLYKMVDEVLMTPELISSYQDAITPKTLQEASELFYTEGMSPTTAMPGATPIGSYFAHGIPPPHLRGDEEEEDHNNVNNSSINEDDGDVLSTPKLATPTLQLPLSSSQVLRGPRSKFFPPSVDASLFGPLIDHNLRVDTFTCNYALKDRNPVDNVHFFSKWDDTKSFKLEKEQVSLLIPNTFSERSLRVFVTDPMQTSLAQHSFRYLLSKLGTTSPGPQYTISRSNTQSLISTDGRASSSGKRGRAKSMESASSSGSIGLSSSSSATATHQQQHGNDSLLISPVKKPKTK